jgi:PAS domain S-box-containing protein
MAVPRLDDEDDLLRSVAIRNAQSILLARQRAEETLEARTAELERALVALRYQSELTRTLTENAASCLLMLDEEGHATYMNPAAIAETRYTLAELSRGPFHEFLHDDAAHSLDDCPIRVAREQLVTLKNQRDHFRRSDGSTFPVSCSLSPLQRDGRAAGAVLEFRDVSDELRAQQALEDANRRKDQFLATLSHELRTPMTAVLGWVRMLKLGLPEADAREAIETIERSALIQAQLIDDVLDVSRVVAGKMTLHPLPVNLGTVLHAAMSTVHPAAAAKGIELLSSVPPLLPRVLGDEGRLQQVIWNLLSNAVKFTPRGGVVTTRLARVSSIVRLTVQDTGSGIDPSFLPHVFEPFSQEDGSSTRSHEGIGIGLSIVRSLVELHGGRIRAWSEGSGRGAKFIVELPALEEAPVLVPQPAAGAAPSTSAELPTLRGLRILVIDDQDATRDLVAAIFRRADADVDAASSVQEGLARLDARAPNVIVCDLAMPGEDGYAFVRAVRALPAARNMMPVIALTAFARPEDRHLALAAGFDAYLKKPVDPEELAATVLRLSAR